MSPDYPISGFCTIEMSDLRYKGLLNEGVQDWDQKSLISHVY